ncbi:MAG: hypothetical protein ACQEVA_10585 [Myxococcota bacterium]
MSAEDEDRKSEDSTDTLSATEDDQPAPGELSSHDDILAYLADKNPGANALFQRFKASLHTIGSLPELKMRAAKLGETLEALPVDEASWWLDQLVRGAIWGHEPEYDAMLACGFWLIQKRQEDDYSLFERLYRQAHKAGREVVLSLLRDPPPHQALPEGRRLPEPRLQLDREVSVGERRQMARSAKRKMIDQLLLDPNPLVVSQVLRNPVVRESDVLQIASRRPNTPEILFEVIQIIRWYKRNKVREALVMNPYNSTGQSLRLLPTLGIQTLRSVRNSRHIHPAVIETAGLLVELREQRTAPWKV